MCRGGPVCPPFVSIIWRPRRVAPTGKWHIGYRLSTRYSVLSTLVWLKIVIASIMNGGLASTHYQGGGVRSVRGSMRHEVLTWADVDKLIDTLIPQLRVVGSFEAILMITR